MNESVNNGYCDVCDKKVEHDGIDVGLGLESYSNILEIKFRT